MQPLKLDSHFDIERQTAGSYWSERDDSKCSRTIIYNKNNKH